MSDNIRHQQEYPIFTREKEDARISGIKSGLFVISKITIRNKKL
jgi:hypothetical protein